MHLRRATAADIPALSALSALAFWDDPLFAFMSPHRAAFPDDFQQNLGRQLSKALYSVNDHLIASETDELDSVWTGTPVLTGCAVWQREGTDVNVVIPRTLQTLREAYIDYFRLDRSISRENVAIADPILSSDHFSELPNRWYLRFLTVQPALHRRGIGTLLVQWGLDRAHGDGVPAMLESAPMAVALYRKCAFQDCCPAKIAEGVEGLSMIYIPEGVSALVTHKQQVRDIAISSK
ncbi:MAG: hypothetical protein M1829_001358 [Trizodia sp. TS-e1964]|nr:MAG: hypothetical protein M1829_001358 [Trizodia sp. TS-e1964]